MNTGVFWDYDNVHIPRILKAHNKIEFVLPRISDFLRDCHQSEFVTFKIFGASTIPKYVHNELTKNGFTDATITIVPGGKDSCDLKLMSEVMRWVKLHEAPARILLISGDRDYANLLHRLRMENYEICLASNKDVSDFPSPLLSSAFYIWKLDDIVIEEEDYE